MGAPRILVVGSSGMLGRELEAACRRRALEVRAVAGRTVVDVTDGGAVHDAVTAAPVDVVINATGLTDVDGAETHPRAAERVNADGPRHLAVACRAAGAVLVHFSTDYVFDGRAQQPYRVDDPAYPINVYGWSKLAGERAVVESGVEHLIVRTSWLYAPHGRNFARTILNMAARQARLDVVDDQHGRPTAAADLADMTLDLIERGARGTVHAAGDGEATWLDLARTLVRAAGLTCDVQPCATAPGARPAARPRYSVLDLSTTTTLIGAARPWPEAAASCARQICA